MDFWSIFQIIILNFDIMSLPNLKYGSWFLDTYQQTSINDWEKLLNIQCTRLC